ncbi:hypothetical protein K501DRAFT_265967 [Backusella circina FSU 941]|nr:hypothetical protein K501DRAFT_265967 [Backusella circina FSU 941]
MLLLSYLPVNFGVGPHQDPLKFLEDFYETASSNNWISESRRKELFLRCMTGYAREWFNNNVDRTSEAYRQISFDKEDNAQSLTTYRDRRQQTGESAWEYMNMKCALYSRAHTGERLELTEAQIVTDLRLGLISSHARFIDAWENNPLVGGANKKVNTYQKLEEVLRWAEMYPAVGINGNVNPTARTDIYKHYIIFIFSIYT